MLVGYLRVSTLEQASADRTSIQEQERRIRGCALMRGQDVMELFVDPGISGTMPLSDRPSGKRMLATVQRGDIIVASKLDRVFRNAGDALATIEGLHQRGVGLILTDMGCDVVTQSSTGKLFFSMLAAFAEFERARMSERLADGMRGKRQRGGHTGGAAPYGFRVEGKGREAILIPVEQEQSVIRLVRELRDGRSLETVAGELNARGIAPRRGVQFHPMQIKRMLERPIQEAAE